MSRKTEMEAVIEAILFASPEPVPRARLVDLFDEKNREAVGEALDQVVSRLEVESESRGIRVEEVAGGLRIVTRPELHGHLRSYFDLSGQNRLSMAALETLAIVAYRQPITGPEIQDLRGVNSSGVLKTLLDRRLIKISGRKQVVGKPFIYRTTREFLMHFGLKRLDDLPPLEEFEESFGSLGEEIEPDPNAELEMAPAESEVDPTEQGSEEPVN